MRVTNHRERLEWWAQRNACSNKTEEVLNDGKVHHYSWTCDSKEGMLQHYKIEDMGNFNPMHTMV
jgi:poly(3-hydroxybutyrate) depolymerase